MNKVTLIIHEGLTSYVLPYQKGIEDAFYKECKESI